MEFLTFCSGKKIDLMIKCKHLEQNKVDLYVHALLFFKYHKCSWLYLGNWPLIETPVWAVPKWHAKLFMRENMAYRSIQTSLAGLVTQISRLLEPLCLSLSFSVSLCLCLSLSASVSPSTPHPPLSRVSSLSLELEVKVELEENTRG